MRFIADFALRYELQSLFQELQLKRIYYENSFGHYLHIKDKSSHYLLIFRILFIQIIKQMVKIELPLPPLYYQAKTSFNICSSFLLFNTLASFSLLLENVTSLKVRCTPLQVARQSIYLSIIFSLLTIFANFQMQAKGATFRQVLQHPFSLVMGSLIFFICLRLPCSSLAISAASFLLLLILACKCLKKSMLICDGVTFGLASILISLQRLIDEGYVKISLKTIAFLLGVILTIISIMTTVGFIDSYRINKTQKKLIYEISAFKLIFPMVILQSILLSNLLCLCLFCVYQHFFVKTLLVSMIQSLSLLFLLFFFKQEIILLWSCPPYSKHQTIFRIHHREYLLEYDPSLCQRSQKWSDQFCLLCDKTATIVIFPCGHLTLCPGCLQRIKDKPYKVCFLCGKEYVQSKQLQKLANVTYGYQRKMFIEKKLKKNQVKVSL